MTLPFEDCHDETTTATDDAALAAALLARRCTGALWVDTRESLARYGVATLSAVLLDGDRLFVLTAKLGRPVRLDGRESDLLRRDPHVLDELVGDAVLQGIDLFREHAILGGRWHPVGGAGLRSYFVNGCLLCLANLVRRWRAARRRESRDEPYGPEDLDLLRGRETADDVVDLVVGSDHVAHVLTSMGQQLADAVRLRIQTGWTWAEIAVHLGLSRKALERKLHRFRRDFDPRGLGTP